MLCATCGTVFPKAAGTCPTCGTSVGQEPPELVARARQEPSTSVTQGTDRDVPKTSSTTRQFAGVEEANQVFGGRYEVRQLLGEGGRGVVYRAHDLELDEPIALKLLQPEYTQNEPEIAQFKREIVNARKITHPNVVRIHDLQYADSIPFISMELLTGGTLRDRLKVGPMTIEDALLVSVALADGLAAVHSAEIVHRDLKPENILFSEKGVPKLVDFGIARLSTTGERTRGVIRGTPQYMSPEQFKGRSISTRSDVYSFGVVMYRMFTNQVPFRATESVVLARMHAYDPPLPPRSLRDDVPEAVEAIILRCLEKDPDQRFQDGTQLRRRLRAVQQDLGMDQRTDYSTVWTAVPALPGFTRRTPPEEESTTVSRDGDTAVSVQEPADEPGSHPREVPIDVIPREPVEPPVPASGMRRLMTAIGIIALAAIAFTGGRYFRPSAGLGRLVHTPPAPASITHTELGYFETPDYLADGYGFLILAEENSNTGKRSVLTLSNGPQPWGLRIDEDVAREAVARAAENGKAYAEWRSDEPDPRDPRSVTYRLYQKDGAPTRLEIEVVGRKSASEGYPPRALSVAWPYSPGL